MTLGEITKQKFYRLHLNPSVSKVPIDVQFIGIRGYREIKEINPDVLEEMTSNYREHFSTLEWLGLVETSDNSPAILVCRKLTDLNSFDDSTLEEAKLVAIPEGLVDWVKSDQLVRSVYLKMNIHLPGLDADDDEISEEVITKAILENMYNIIYIPENESHVDVERDERLVLGRKIRITMNKLRNAKKDLEDAQINALKKNQDKRNSISQTLSSIRDEEKTLKVGKEELVKVFDKIKEAGSDAGIPTNLDGYSDFESFIQGII